MISTKFGKIVEDLLGEVLNICNPSKLLSLSIAKSFGNPQRTLFLCLLFSRKPFVLAYWGLLHAVEDREDKQVNFPHV
jgi:hypothetical protein